MSKESKAWSLSIRISYHRKLALPCNRFSLTITSLEKIWIPGRADLIGDIAEASESSADGEGQNSHLQREESTSSNVSLGDTHIWRDNGDDNV